MFATSGRMPACATFGEETQMKTFFCQWLWAFAIGNFITTCSSNSVISCWFFSSCGPARSLSQAPFRGLVENGDVQWAGSGQVVWSVMGTGTLLLLVCLFQRLLGLSVVSYACHNSFAGHWGPKWLQYCKGECGLSFLMLKGSKRKKHVRST